jgi:hypothetical protein
VDSKLLLTFHEATEKRGLIEEDNMLNESLAEATRSMMPYALRRLFATILVFCEPNNMFGLWEKHKEAMSEDYKLTNQSTFLVVQMVLIDIQKLLQSMQKDIKMYSLPDIDDTYDASRDIPREIFEEASIEANEDDVALSDTLNEEQQAVYDDIMSSVDIEDGGLYMMTLCPRLILRTGVSSLWMVLVGPERLICTEHFSLLYVVRKRLLWQQLHLVSQPQ